MRYAGHWRGAAHSNNEPDARLTGCRAVQGGHHCVLSASGGPQRDVGDDRVMDERAPADGVRRHREVIGLLSDDELMARIEGLRPLPDADDDDPAWLEDATWDRAEFLVAAADAVGERQLLQAIAPLFQRAALGDGYEMMQGLRHGPERAVAPDWQLLTSIMRPLTRHQRAGCRRWAVRELGILRDPPALDDLVAALGDEEPLVRSEACTSLGMLSQAELHARPQIRAYLQPIAELDTSSLVRRHAQWAIETIT
jgi:HEAT repeat protein